MLHRSSGKLCFATLQDGDGFRLQGMLSLDAVGAQALADWKRLVDIGDHVSLTGEVTTSRRGELSVRATEWQMASKALRPLPVAHKPMTEETRVRQRYVDLIMRPEAWEIAWTRPKALRAVRDFFDDRGFIEVETPMLQTIQGGANARPFVTESNAFGMDLFLRISPELFLKRCVVGGLHKVFEVNRNFRNEGADSTHSPEFTMLEFYEAYADYSAMATVTQELVQSVAYRLSSSHVVSLADGSEYDFGGEWPRVSMFRSLSDAVGEEVTVDTGRDRLMKLVESRGLRVDPSWDNARIAEKLFEELVVPTLQRPTFVFDYPAKSSPLTRGHRSEPGLAEKWDLYVRGFEIATGYTELIDPVIQRERLEIQARAARSGDHEAMPLDEDFLRALEYGMVPTGGTGMGIDRLLMGITGLNIRETVLFPVVRPESGASSETRAPSVE
jgi:lysyl-tRNA synthetase class 2